ncbi:MAG: hypothetical protein QOG04_1652 [Actinomycetota bacterium]|jgi:photosystem II stability/assembly factor-like uncharacterized protein|nr:hypothetical protein [Actinomycetota bacterium]
MTKTLKLLIVVALAFSMSSTGLGLAFRSRPVSTIASASSVAAPAVEEEDEGLEVEPNSPGADWLINQRTGRHGTISANAYRRALQQSVRAEQRTIDNAPELAAAEWSLMGPTNIGGRVNDVAVDPILADTVYAATAGGGVWKSTDAGINWSYSWPDDITQTMGAIATAPDGTLYAGTGESNPGGGSITYGGTGIYRSRDHGETWQFIGLPQSGAFGRIMVDPLNPQRVLAAAAGNLYKRGGQRGLFLSEDGGDTWNRVLAPENDTTGAVDIALDEQNPNNILVAMWDHHRLPSHRVYTGTGSGVWRSTDGGLTWTEIPLAHGLADADVGRIGVAFAPSSPSRAYAIVASKPDGTGVGLFRSDDGGASFTKTAASVSSLSQSSYGWWFGRLYVDPDTADRLWITGLNLQRSTDGGASASSVSGPHSDQHAMAWDPKVANRVYLGNDGGMYTSATDGNAWTHAVKEGWTQSYSVDVGELTPGHVVTGLQDNGCIKNWSATASGIDKWTSFGCGDGLETLINPTHEQTLYACSQYGGCSVGADGLPLGVPMTFTSPRKGWWTPIIFDPADSLTMYFGGNTVERSLNGGVAWTAISPDLTRNETQLDPNSGYRIRHVITAIARSASDASTMWAGTDDGLVWKTTNLVGASPTWTQIQSSALPDTQWVTRVTVDPTDVDTVYVTYSGYRNGEDGAHVFKTTDAGTTWTDISGDLPDAPANDLVVVGDRLIVATDVGVFVSDGDGEWFKLGSNLPAVPVIEMRYHQPTNTLTLATFGHGVQRTTLPF